MQGRKTKPLDGPALLNYSLRILSVRALSTAEIKERLHRRALNPSDVDEVLAKLKDAGYLDDSRFAESYAAARRDNQGFGQARVLRDLKTRRVPGKLAGEVVREAFEDVDETAMIEQFLARKYRGKNLGEFLAVDKNLASAYRRLRVAGFSAGSTIRVLKRYASQAGELEGQEDPADQPAGE
jgi:regulatory protein